MSGCIVAALHTGVHCILARIYNEKCTYIASYSCDCVSISRQCNALSCAIRATRPNNNNNNEIDHTMIFSNKENSTLTENCISRFNNDIIHYHLLNVKCTK